MPLLNENIMHETVERMKIVLVTDRFIEYNAPRNIDWYRSLNEQYKSSYSHPKKDVARKKVENWRYQQILFIHR
jgi:hypothetical protein